VGGRAFRGVSAFTCWHFFPASFLWCVAVAFGSLWRVLCPCCVHYAYWSGGCAG